ncbi:hypothetical protein GP486_006909 [Trichoglossum hirsutum]|uniref:Uncharacterized protein n=1 Tax=Trichoglossum hirsutum TaxID=265104 RepID=A0A9P8IIR0_9PEZI|nr:hypothetical protein GP486_006909 [Trichoglossum hirsutum]
MPAFFSKVFRSRDGAGVSKKHALQTSASTAPQEPQWQDAWLRNEVSPDEVQELLRACTQEVKSRDQPQIPVRSERLSATSSIRDRTGVDGSEETSYCRNYG